jgi:hypothetical protein
MCSLRFENNFSFYRRCSLCFDIEENTIVPRRLFIPVLQVLVHRN